MGIINRDLHPTQRRDTIQIPIGALATGVTTVIGIVPSDGLVMSGFASSFGLSGTPTASFSLYRIVSGGFTQIGLGATVTPPAYGTSGMVAATLIGGVTCLRGDLIVSLSGGTNSAVASAVHGVVLQPQVDFLNFPGC